MRYLVILLFLSSCSCDWHLQRAEAKGCVRDTVKTETTREVSVTPFDTTIWILKHKVADQEFVNCDSLYAMLSRHSNTITTKENGVKATIIKVGDRLVFKCETDSLKAVIELLRTQIKESKITNKTKVIEVDKPKWIDGFYKRAFWFYSIIMGLSIGAWYVKKRCF